MGWVQDFSPWTQSMLWQYGQSVQKQAGGFLINPPDSGIAFLCQDFHRCRDVAQVRSESKFRIPKISRKFMRYQAERCFYKYSLIIAYNHYVQQEVTCLEAGERGSKTSEYFVLLIDQETR